MTQDNLHRKAASCRADLVFLLSLIPFKMGDAQQAVNKAMNGLVDPTEEKITAAWQLAATVHEEIRKI